MFNPLEAHRLTTRELAASLQRLDVYRWLVEYGYFPENYVLPPCFRVSRSRSNWRRFTELETTNRGIQFRPPQKDGFSVQFPKSELADRTYGIMHPELHHDIAVEISENWPTIIDCLLPEDSRVCCYSFPVPIDKNHPGRIGHVRSGRMVYEFLQLTEADLVALAHEYTHIVRADIKNFYPSIYTHSISWVLHGKPFIRSGHRSDCSLVGNRLDRLFQYANDQCTNGIPIGPAVSDIIAEMIASGVDKLLSQYVAHNHIECALSRFKDDYRILVKSESDGKKVIKRLQTALKEFNLELNETKTSVYPLPEGLFRPWVSLYHAAYPRKRSRFTWREFKELYLAVLRIDAQHPGTGVIDRFLADIISKRQQLKLNLSASSLPKALSMLLMLGSRRSKAFPKVIAIIEAVLKSQFGQHHAQQLTSYLDSHFRLLSQDEQSNKYLLAWIAYFMASNALTYSFDPSGLFTDPVLRSIVRNENHFFRDSTEFTIFEECRTAGARTTMLEHLDLFNPPRPT